MSIVLIVALGVGMLAVVTALAYAIGTIVARRGWPIVLAAVLPSPFGYGFTRLYIEILIAKYG